MAHIAHIKIKSTVDGAEIYNEYEGEYKFANSSHNFVYTDYTGNAVTKNAVEANSEQMLLHRVGAINGDMLFDKLTDTVTRYDAFFIMIGTNWANHHHLLQVTNQVNGKIIWSNLFYLFTLSFYPVATGWVGKSRFSMITTQIKKELPNLHITMKINCSDFMLGGLTQSDSMQICKQCVDKGLDSVEVSGAGTSVPRIKAGVNEAYFKDFAFELAKQIDIPIILVGGHRSIENMESVLNEGKIEYLSLSRPLIREPDLINRWQDGDTAPAKCVSCNMCYRTDGHKCAFNR